MLTHTHKKKVVHELMKMLNVVRKNIKNKKCFNGRYYNYCFDAITQNSYAYV